MKRLSVTTIALLCLFLSMQAFGQTDASLSGTVTDSSGGVIPGVTVTAKNDNTGIVTTTVSNASGVYNFPRLLPGIYTINAEMQSFQSKSVTKLTLQTSQQVHLNFLLEVKGKEDIIVVDSTKEKVIVDREPSSKDVLDAEQVAAIPQVNRNVLDFVRISSAVVLSDDPIFNANGTTIAGVNAAGVNIQRDGVTVNDVRWPAGINAATRVNPDLVGEFRMVLAPVDAEIGRGNAQIQISTRSGTNDYHGNLVWTVQNTALDPNTWYNNRENIDPPWRNLHQFSGSLGGPIIKNKTFFFVLFDGQLNKIRTPYTTRVATPCARKGIFRFFDYWNNANAAAGLTLGGNPSVAVVNRDGSPTPPPALKPSMIDQNGNHMEGWEPHNGLLRYASVFGRLREGFVPDSTCSNYNPATDLAGEAWDPYRTQQDPTGYIEDFMGRMPAANSYVIGDGLNTAGHTWSRTLLGADNLFGIGEDTYRRQINTRIDHTFNDAHRIHGSWSWEKSWADDSFKNWPDGYQGKSERRPMVITVNLISSLRSNLLNEARFGMSRTGSNIASPYTNPDTGEELKSLLPAVNSVPLIIGPGAGVFNFSPDDFTGNGSGYYGGRGILAYSGEDTSPRWTIGDTMSWTRGTHSLRFGGEYRRASSEARNQWNGGYTSYPYAGGGETVTVQGITSENLGFGSGADAQLLGTSSSGNISAMEDQLNFLAGSLGQIRQWRYINDSNQTTWNDPVADPALVRDTVQKEFSWFFKDDWKVTQDLTLNLGVRHDYYGVPYLNNGLTTTLKGGTGHLFGMSGDSFDCWFKECPADTPEGDMSELEFVGSGTANPYGKLYPRDWNNFGPAVGFAYQLPWFGKGQTAIRAGYQINYIGNVGRAAAIQTAAGEAPGTTYTNNYTGGGSYLDIQRALNEELVPAPMPEDIEPGIKQFPVTDRRQNITVFAPDYVSPYVQNIVFAVTRNLTSNLTVDLRYMGTLQRKAFSTININLADFLTNGLLEAFNEARAGRNPALLDDLLMGQVLAPWTPPVNGVTYFGGDALRDAAWPNFNLGFGDPGFFTNMNQMLARGDYQGLANAFNSFGAPPGQLIRQNGFPENFIKANPQFNNATYEWNGGHSNYHSFQAQVTLRPTHGVEFMSTYTWAKNLGVDGGAGYDPRDRWADYSLMPSDRRHNWVTYGGYMLPFGPGQMIGKTSSGALARFIEGWKADWITTVQSGAALNIGVRNAMYGQGAPDLVGDFDYDSIGVYWPDGADRGNYFGGRYDTVNDPQCANVWAGGQGLCTTGLQALRDTRTGEIVFQNPLPGTRGNFGYNRISGPMRWDVSMALSKMIQIDEARSFRVRVDMANIFNHAQPSGTQGSVGTRIVYPTAPSTNMNAGIFGDMPVKVGGRTFQLMARFDF
jgi:hypothetical protein